MCEVFLQDKFSAACGQSLVGFPYIFSNLQPTGIELLQFRLVKIVWVSFEVPLVVKHLTVSGVTLEMTQEIQVKAISERQKIIAGLSYAIACLEVATGQNSLWQTSIEEGQNVLQFAHAGENL